MTKINWKKVRTLGTLLVGSLLFSHCWGRVLGCGIKEVGSRVVAGTVGAEETSVEEAGLAALTGGVERELNPGAGDEKKEIEGEVPGEGSINGVPMERVEGESPNTIGPRTPPIEVWNDSRPEANEELLKLELPKLKPTPPDWLNLNNDEYSATQWAQFYNWIQLIQARILPRRDMVNALNQACPQLYRLMSRLSRYEQNPRAYTPFELTEDFKDAHHMLRLSLDTLLVRASEGSLENPN